VFGWGENNFFHFLLFGKEKDRKLFSEENYSLPPQWRKMISILKRWKVEFFPSTF